MIEIVNCDAAELLPLCADAHVLITDPPYRPHVHEKATSQSSAGGTRHREFGFASLTPELRKTIATAVGLVRRWSVIYTDIESVGTWMSAVETSSPKAEYIRAIVWSRWSMPNLQGDRPPQGCEAMTVFHPKGRKRWNGRGNLVRFDHEVEDFEASAGELGALEHLALRGEGKHKTEKPLDQMLDLVSWFSEPGETVVDLTAGRGTTGLACRLLGRNFVGAELQANEVALANERVWSKLSDRDQTRLERWADAVLTEKIDGFTAPSKKRHALRCADVDRALSAIT